MNTPSRFLLIAALAAVASCASQTSDPMRVLKTTPAHPVPDPAMAQRSGESLDRLGRGFTLFERKCLECHEARVPKDPSLAAWHPTMIGMSWNAGLAPKEEADLIAYMKAAAL